MSRPKSIKSAQSKSKPKPDLSSPFLQDKPAHLNPCLPPLRVHSSAYHTPLLLHNEESSKSLLSWFDSTSQDRAMPWRKPWTQQNNTEARSIRAYEVWISEIMLQQTRVSTVIPFYNNWISRWPTVQALALANQDEVLAAWKGLGYYSRATRLHEAAQQIVQNLNGEIPADVSELLRIKGIGRYTAGAVSSIAFGQAVPLLDGNVVRVLSRQMGLYARVKDKKVEDVLWDVARVLVERVAGHDASSESSVPGRWNQGLMELGSTICTPRPKCGECPIQNTCRAYAEGMALVKGETAQEQDVVDIEDSCTMCLPLPPEDLPQDIQGKRKNKKRPAETALPTRTAKKSKQSTLDFFTGKPAVKAETKTESEPLPDQIAAYTSLFPARDVKKAVPTQDCLVCIIQRPVPSSKSPSKKSTAKKGGTYLIEQRPDKGLLANLWQFPNLQLSDPVLDEKDRAQQARQFLLDMLADVEGEWTLGEPVERGCYMHVFTHLKLRMFVLGFVLECEDGVAEWLLGKGRRRMWVDEGGVEDATLGAGMQRCWKEFLAG